MIKANSTKEAWAIVDRLFPTDYIKDDKGSENAGYPIYRSTCKSLPNSHYNYICDLGNCLEINLCDADFKPETIRISIEEPEIVAASEMHEYILTVGLFDKETEKQEIETEAAKNIIADTLISKFEIFAFTMIDCTGVYKMSSTGRIVREPSIRIEIVTDADIESTIHKIIAVLKSPEALNQESIMVKHSTENIAFA